MAGDLPTEVDSVQIHAASSGGRVTYGPSPRMFGIYAGNYGGVLKAIPTVPDTFDLDIPAMEAAITRIMAGKRNSLTVQRVST